MIATPLLETERLRLEPVRGAHADALLAYYVANEAHLAPWEPARPPGFLTASYWRVNAESYERDAAAQRSYSFVAFERERPRTIVAQINLWNIVRGVAQSATLGYSVAGDVQGRGIGTAAVGRVVDHAFTDLGLHRVVATYQPTNERSGRLLRRIGFVVEGYARDYLFIDGAWRDSVLTAKVRPEA